MTLHCVFCQEKLKPDLPNKRGNTFSNCYSCYRTQLEVHPSGEIVYYCIQSVFYTIIGSKINDEIRWNDHASQDIKIKFMSLRANDFEEGYKTILSRIEKISRFQ